MTKKFIGVIIQGEPVTIRSSKEAGLIRDELKKEPITPVEEVKIMQDKVKKIVKEYVEKLNGESTT